MDTIRTVPARELNIVECLDIVEGIDAVRRAIMKEAYLFHEGEPIPGIGYLLERLEDRRMDVRRRLEELEALADAAESENDPLEEDIDEEEDPTNFPPQLTASDQPPLVVFKN